MNTPMLAGGLLLLAACGMELPWTLPTWIVGAVLVLLGWSRAAS